MSAPTLHGPGRGLRAWAACVLSVVPFAGTLVFGPQSGMEALIILVPWMGMLAVHALFALPALAGAWRRPDALRWVVTAWFVVFAVANLALFGWANRVPEHAQAAWMRAVHPADADLLAAVTDPLADIEAVARALAAGARTGAELPDGRTALHVAAGRGDARLVATLLAAGADPQAGATARRDTPLVAAVTGGHVDVALQLLDAGADPARASPDPGRPLCAALNTGRPGALPDDRVRLVTRLLEAGADPAARCEGDLTPWRLVLDPDRPDAVRLFVAAGHRLPDGAAEWVQSRLLAALAAGDTGTVRLLVQAGAQVRTEGGRDLLARAIDRRDVALVRDLLAAGASARAAPYLARAVNTVEDPLPIVEALLAAGAEVDRPGDDGLTPLALAALNGHGPAMRRLLEAGARADTDGYNGVPLLVAVLRDTDPATRTLAPALLAARADANRADPEGWTPLMVTLGRQDPARAEGVAFGRALLAAGADPDARNADGDTAAHVLAGTIDMAEPLTLLIGAGADLELAGADGLTPLCRARQAGLESQAALLRAAGARDDGCR